MLWTWGFLHSKRPERGRCTKLFRKKSKKMKNSYPKKTIFGLQRISTQMTMTQHFLHRIDFKAVGQKSFIITPTNYIPLESY